MKCTCEHSDFDHINGGANGGMCRWHGCRCEGFKEAKVADKPTVRSTMPPTPVKGK